MSKIQSLSFFKPEDRWPLVETFLNPGELKGSQPFFVLSDVHTKEDYEKRLRNRSRPITSPQKEKKEKSTSPPTILLRAHEFWLQIFQNRHEEVKILPPHLMNVYIKEALQDEEKQWLQKSYQTLVDFIDLFIPILVSPEALERVRSWISDRPQSLIQWWGWLERGENYVRQILHENLTSTRWIVPLLLKSLRNHSLKETELISISPVSPLPSNSKSFLFDLGSRVSTEEFHLIQELSVLQQVEKIWILQRQLPKPAPSPMKSSNLNLEPTDKNNTPPSLSCSLSWHQLSSPLSEARQAVHLISEWVHKKRIPPPEIAIIAPRVEDYWPLLDPLLEAEEIPVQKNRVLRLHGLPRVNQWLSQLRLSLGKISFEDLEALHYGEGRPENLLLSHEEFRSLFLNVCETDELRRNPGIWNSLQEKSRPRGLDLLNFEDMWTWASGLWPKPKATPISTSDSIPNPTPNSNSNADPNSNPTSDLLKTLGEELKKEIPSTLHLQPLSWLDYLERWMSQKEEVLRNGTPGGIHLLNLDSADGSGISRRIFLGLNEGALSPLRELPVSQRDLLSLDLDLGYPLKGPQDSDLEFELQWLLSSGENHLMTSLSDHRGNPQSPHPLFFTHQQESIDHNKDPLGPIAWDRLMEGGREEKYSSQPKRGYEMNPWPLTLSASTLQKYADCPFIVNAEKFLKFSDQGETDLDVDTRESGLLVHALFSRIMKHRPLFQASRQDIHRFLDEILIPPKGESKKKILKFNFLDPSLKKALRETYVNLGLRFQSREEDRLKAHPELEFWDTEMPFEVVLEPFPDSDRQVRLRGVIDRVDQVRPSSPTESHTETHAKTHSKTQAEIHLETDPHWIIYDYKGTEHSGRSFSGWIKNNQVQLGVYSFVTKSIGAFYYVYKDFSMNHGFLVETFEPQFFSPPKFPSKKSQILTEKERHDFFSEIKDWIFKQIQAMDSGYFPPTPRDPKLCDDCRWRKLCRAPHLTT